MLWQNLFYSILPRRLLLFLPSSPIYRYLGQPSIQLIHKSCICLVEIFSTRNTQVVFSTFESVSLIKVGEKGKQTSRAETAVWPDWAFFKLLGDKCYFKSSPSKCDFLGSFENIAFLIKNCCAYFFRQLLAYTLFRHLVTLAESFGDTWKDFSFSSELAGHIAQDKRLVIRSQNIW